MVPTVVTAAPIVVPPEFAIDSVNWSVSLLRPTTFLVSVKVGTGVFVISHPTTPVVPAGTVTENTPLAVLVVGTVVLSTEHVADVL